MNDSYYKVKQINRPIICEVEVPGSKSITSRALLLASMAKGQSVLSNVLFSGDSRSFLSCIKALGYDIEIDENERIVKITGSMPQKKGSINVGSAGTAARFITAMLAACEGEYFIDASEQMKRRPMNTLLEVLSKLGSEIECIEKDGHLPLKMKGRSLEGGNISLDIGNSSQFLSALLMTGFLYKKGLQIQVQGRETSRPYVDITLKMMEQFGKCVERTSEGHYRVSPNRSYTAQKYKIEPDVSSACYFYAMAAITGGEALVKDVYYSSMQGDIKFLDVLKTLGCTVEETDKGLLVKGPVGGKYKGIDIDMNDFSDQTMTLAVLAVFASSPTRIRNIEHIRHQESDRIHAVASELARIGIKCIDEKDEITIYPGMPKPAVIETYEDHRMAMAFSLVGLKVDGIKIKNPSCVSKTFEKYFDILDKVIEQNSNLL